MRFELKSHVGVIMIDPKIELIGTFKPSIRFIESESIRIAHTLPPQLTTT